MSGLFSSSEGVATKSSARSSVLQRDTPGTQFGGELTDTIIPGERDRVGAIQRQLAQETLFRSRGFGLRSLLGVG